VIKSILILSLFWCAGLAQADLQENYQKIIDLFQPEFSQLGFKGIVNYISYRPSIQCEVERWPESRAVATFELSAGFVRSDELTDDAKTLQICHEMGHLLGGTPLKPGDTTQIPTLSVEGQADYFATSFCLRRVWGKKLPDQKIPSYRICKNSFPENTEAQLFCNRAVDASKSLALFDYEFTNREADAERLKYQGSEERKWFDRKPSIGRNETTIVNETVTDWPSPQCRLDTFIAGILCDHAAIEIKNGNVMFSACEEQNSRRPACWYRDNQIKP
jgi:hypothetical protein